MLKKLMSFLGGDDEAKSASPSIPDEQIAVTVLLIEAAKLDGSYDDVERDAIANMVENHFGLEAEARDALLAHAHDHHEASVEIFKFTHRVKEAFGEDERIQMIEMMWQIVYADGEVHDYEASLLRRVGGLLHVPDRAAGEARKRAQQKTSKTDN